MAKKINKKGQITIFIVVAVLLIAGVGIFFLIRNIQSPGRGTTPSISSSFIQICMEDNIRNTIQEISSQGGYIENNLSIKFKFSDEKDYTNISYLCYIDGLFSPCINQEPMLIEHLSKEIEKAISSNVEQCFSDYANGLEQQGYEVQKTYNGFKITLAPEKVILTIDGGITTEKAGETITLNKIESIFSSKFYDLAIIAQDIVNKESMNCNYEQLNQMLINPDISIDKFRSGDYILIYRITHKQSKDVFKFAIRGCVLPAVI
ncbi:MAG TPA: hypothetical protein VJ438_06510 [Candidatus Nanoarchaeia archaeon]|nr:hypothetical protein [Candidatus Nanoarchaeia archaeon]